MVLPRSLPLSPLDHFERSRLRFCSGLQSVRLYIYPFTETHVLIWLRIRPRNYVNSIEYTISLHKKRKIEYY
ncbi:hypothetical protein RB195_012597 [Necator americanus]|uniref:Uncharacterized protein n=1 Tax=Necator americanus TaxID=51031 RepID=A0ABR1DRP5_NECAM